MDFNDDSGIGEVYDGRYKIEMFEGRYGSVLDDNEIHSLAKREWRFIRSCFNRPDVQRTFEEAKVESAQLTLAGGRSKQLKNYRMMKFMIGMD